jgi:hypothetical protein
VGAMKLLKAAVFETSSTAKDEPGRSAEQARRLAGELKTPRSRLVRASRRRLIDLEKEWEGALGNRYREASRT